MVHGAAVHGVDGPEVRGLDAPPRRQQRTSRMECRARLLRAPRDPRALRDACAHVFHLDKPRKQEVRPSGSIQMSTRWQCNSTYKDSQSRYITLLVTERAYFDFGWFRPVTSRTVR